MAIGNNEDSDDDDNNDGDDNNTDDESHTMTICPIHQLTYHNHHFHPAMMLMNCRRSCCCRSQLQQKTLPTPRYTSSIKLAFFCHLVFIAGAMFAMVGVVGMTFIRRGVHYY